jgi:hypothetical protein
MHLSRLAMAFAFAGFMVAPMPALITLVLLAAVVRPLAMHASASLIARAIPVAGLGGGSETNQSKSRTDDDGVAHFQSPELLFEPLIRRTRGRLCLRAGDTSLMADVSVLSGAI